MDDLQSKYRAAMAARFEAYREKAEKRGAGRPAKPLSRVADAIGLPYKVVKANRLHCWMSEEAWIASYKQAGREDDGA